jgi:hypothetical protein
MKLYAVCFDLQQKEIDALCFKKCKKIIMAGLVYADLNWFPCRCETCQFEERTENIGEVILRGKPEEVILRKLKTVGE